ncbi:MAG: hypothetical protein HY351_03255 [Candidatus Omnitrophica bacterium]|nr:hypothetical protein [Candidatus Omnitrophota bacterium]
MDPQVEETYGLSEWAITNYPKFVENFIEEGDEIALHPHAYRWSTEINHWIEDLGNQEWVNHCCEMGFHAYEKLFHKTCESFRFGAYWTSADTVNLIERLGARFDLTVEPGLKVYKKPLPQELYSAPLPNYDDVPREPYHPSQEDPTRPDPSRGDGIWMIPMSTSRVEYRFSKLGTLYRGVFNRNELKPRVVTLNFARGTNGFQIAMENLLTSLKQPYLAMVVRSDVCGEYCSSPNGNRFMKLNMDYIMNHPLANRFVFSTPREAMETMGFLAQGQAVSQ